MSDSANKKSKEAVRGVDGLSAMLLNSLDDYAIVMLDPDGNILTWNTGAERTKGYKATEAVGKHFSMFYTDEANAAGHPQHELDIARESGRHEAEGWRIRKDKTKFWASDVTSTVRDPESNDLIGFSKVTRDLGDKKHPTGVRASELMLSRMVDSVEDYAIFMLDPNGIILTWNAGAQRAKGYKAEEIIGKHFSQFYSEEAKAINHPAHELEIATKEGRYEEEGWRIRKDGTEFWANVVITAVRDEQGQLLGFAKVTRDLTERKLAEENLQRTEAMLARMVESVKDYAIFMLDPNGNILTWNEGAARIKGYTASEAIGKHFSIFYDEEAKAINHPQHELELAIANGRYEEEGWRVRKDGSQFWANVVITAVYGKSGGLLGFAKVTRDLTEQRKAKLELEGARDQAIIANKMKSQFVANISHEIRTPLSGIVGLAQLVAQEPDLDSESKNAVTMIFESAKRLLVILNDLLDFAKLEAGKVAIEEHAYSIKTLIDDVVGLNRPAAQQKHLQLCAETDPKLKTEVIGDAGKIRQILLNLVHNAIKFTEKGGVEVSAEIQAGFIRFAVTDTGIGIEPGAQSKLFQPFVQADGSVSRRFGGSGLGLSIAYQYVQLMGGTIGVTSTPGFGSTFWFTVPAGEMDEAGGING